MTIANLQPATELEAVNAMLSAIGQAPVDSLDTEQVDVEMAVALLRRTAASVQLEGWAFNTDFGVEIAPVGTMDWQDTSGDVVELNVFQHPGSAGKWKVSATPQQMRAQLQLAVRKPKVYTGGPELIFYDRRNQREGLPAADFPYLYLDVVSLLDYEEMPPSARDYVYLNAARRFVSQAVGSSELVGLTQQDELSALRMLKNDQGIEDHYSMFDSMDVSRASIGRRPTMNGYIDNRASPGRMV